MGGGGDESLGEKQVGKWVVKVVGKEGKEFSRKKYSKVRNGAGGGGEIGKGGQIGGEGVSSKMVEKEEGEWRFGCEGGKREEFTK